MQIKELAELAGISVRTLHYYDEIGLLKPARVDAHTGYRYYDAQSILRLQEILFYRELDFSLNHISEILSSPDYDMAGALREQKKLLILKKERLERLILAVDDAMKGANIMYAFDNSEMERYKDEAREKWGGTDAYQEHTQKTKGYSKDKWNALTEEMNQIFAAFAHCMTRGAVPDSAAAQELVTALQNHITQNYYRCTDEILAGLGQMYVADERFRNNIDRHADGTAAFVRDAIAVRRGK